MRGLLQPNCNSELSIEKDTVIFFPLVFVLAPETSCRLRDCGVSLVMATPLRGSVPNTRWPGATLTWEELRTSSNSKAASSTPLSPPPLPPLPPPPPFVPLPPRPASSPPLPPPIDPARVRQDDSALTRLLHRGVLTGGYINALLGLADGGAGAARIGAPRGGSGKRGGGGGGNGKDSSSNKGRRRRRRAPAPERLDPHAAAIEHLRQPRWDFAKEGFLSPDLAEEQAGQTKRKKKTPEEVARGGIVSVRMAWGNAAEAAALRSLAAVLSKTKKKEEHEGLFRCCCRRGEEGAEEAAEAPVSASATLEEVGMLLVPEEALEELGSLPPLPPLAASPDALARHSSSSGGGGGSGGEEEEKEKRTWLEPVEVKCVCPFRLIGRNSARRSGGRAFDDGGTEGRREASNNNDGNNGNPFARFELSDPGPRPLPPASAIPQLHLQMLACGSRSALLVSQSATRGARVWRVARDDDFLRRMLLVASSAFEKHVAGGEPAPPPAASEGSSSRPQQHAAGVEAVVRLADAAVAIAASAKEVALLPPLEGVDPSRAFLQ